MKGLVKMLKKKKLLLFLMLAVSTVFLGCEVDTKVNMIEHNPPSFTFSGSGRLEFIAVSEITGKNEKNSKFLYSSKDLWQICPKDYEHIRIESIPEITYGQLPKNFVQIIPKNNFPEQLVEGKVYSISAITTGANTGFVNFTIKNSTPILLKGNIDHYLNQKSQSK